MTDEARSIDVQGLWQSQSTEGRRATPDEIRNLIERLNRKTRRRSYGGYIVCALVVIGCIWWLTLFDNPLQRIGTVLTIVGVVTLVYQLRSYGRGEKSATRRATEMGSMLLVQFYRKQLERQRDFHRGKRFWSRMLIFAPGPLLFLVGFARAHPEVAGQIRLQGIIFLALVAAAVPLNLWLARTYQRQLNELDRLGREK